MTRQEMKEFAQKQVEFAAKQVAFSKGQTEWTNRQLERTRKEDREQKEWAKTYNNGEYAHLYEGRYVGKETRKYLNERRRWQRDLKHYEAEIIYWTKEVEKYSNTEDTNNEEEETMTAKTEATTITTTNNEKEDTTMKTTKSTTATLNLTEGAVRFEHNGITYKYNQDTKRYSKTVDGKTTRIGKAEYDEAKANHDLAWATYEQEKLDAEPSHVEVENDLEKPAVLNENGLVDCSKCNCDKCVHRNCMRRNPRNVGGLGECPRLDNGIVSEAQKVAEDTGMELAEAELAVNVQNEQKKPRKARKSKDIAYEGHGKTLTAKQVDFLREMVKTDMWDGFERMTWTDVLCDEIGGQFADKPMTVGAMISTLCEKGLAERSKGDFTDPVTNRTRKSTYMTFTELGQEIAEELGV